MCLALLLAFVGVSSQAQGVTITSSEGSMYIMKGVFMIDQDWENFGLLGIEDNLEKFRNGKISAITASFGMYRNFALANGFDTMRGIFTIGETVSGDISLEKVIEGTSYICKGHSLTTNHNWFIGYSKILTQAYDEYDMPSSFIFYPKPLTPQDLRKEWAKTCKLTEACLEISPLYHISKRLFYGTKGTNKIVEGTSMIFSDKVDPTGFVILNRGVRRFIHDASIVNIYLLICPIPIVAPVFFSLCQYRLVHGLTSGVTSNDPNPMLTFNDQKSLALEIFKNARSKFKTATELDLEENGNIVKAISLYRSAIKGYKDCVSMLEDTQKKEKLYCQDESMLCLNKIKSLIGKLKNEVFKILDNKPYDQKSFPTYAKCIMRVLDAEDEIEIKDVLMEYKKNTQSLWAWVKMLFSSNSNQDQLEQLIRG